MTPDLDPDWIALALAEIAAEAGRLLAATPDRTAGSARKADGTQATDADRLSETLILERLAAALPGVPVVAEESCLHHGRADAFLLVDPLDGTSEFLAGGCEYSVNIALVIGDRPVAAALSGPSLGRLWAAGTTALEFFGPEGRAWRPVRARPARHEALVALGSRRHGDPETEACLAAFPAIETRTASSAVKFGLIASGEADIYIRCGPTMEWDTAAGDHILTRAGGCVVGPDGRRLTYGHSPRGYLNGPFAALGDPALAPRLSLPAAARDPRRPAAQAV